MLMIRAVERQLDPIKKVSCDHAFQSPGEKLTIQRYDC